MPKVQDGASGKMMVAAEVEEGEGVVGEVGMPWLPVYLVTDIL
jgi:hypothetical protein